MGNTRRNEKLEKREYKRDIQKRSKRINIDKDMRKRRDRGINLEI